MDERVKVLARFVSSGSVLQGTKSGQCLGFEIELAVESEEEPATIAELLRVARRMCFTDHALSNEIELQITQLLNGSPI